MREYACWKHAVAVAAVSMIPDSCSLSLLGMKEQRLDRWACRLDWACICLPGVHWQKFWVLSSWQCDGNVGDWYHYDLHGKEHCKLLLLALTGRSVPLLGGGHQWYILLTYQFSPQSSQTGPSFIVLLPHSSKAGWREFFTWRVSSLWETWTVADELYRDLLIGVWTVMLKEKMRLAALGTKSKSLVALVCLFFQVMLCFPLLLPLILLQRGFYQRKCLKPIWKCLKAAFQ